MENKDLRILSQDFEINEFFILRCHECRCSLDRMDAVLETCWVNNKTGIAVKWETRCIHCASNIVPLPDVDFSRTPCPLCERPLEGFRCINCAVEWDSEGNGGTTCTT